MEYTQARIQSRFGERPRAESWRGLDAAPDPEAYLDAARGTFLQRWISGIGPDADLHRIDSVLRARFEAHIGEVARWLPQEWRPAALWLLRLFDLPAVQYLSPGEAPDFLRRYRKNLRRGGLPRASEAREAFLEDWVRRWPTRDPESLSGMRRIAATASAHLERFVKAGVRDAWRERARLESELRSLFRKSALRPDAAFCHLALVALDLERLRAALVLRALWRGQRKSA